MIRIPTPCKQLNKIFLLPKNGSFIRFGGRFITFFSSFSASKIMEQEGSMINSRKTMCTGHKIMGKLPNNIGNNDNPAMGTWIAKMYPKDFWRLSNMRLPIRMAPTMDEKLSSMSCLLYTSDAAD